MNAEERHIVLVEDEVLNAKYKFIVRCKCGWTGRCYTEQEADQLRYSHLRAQGILAETSGLRPTGTGGG